MRKFLLLSTAFSVVVFSGAANADLLVNGNFDNSTGFVANGDNAMSVAPGSTTITGWTVIPNTGDGVAWINTPNTFSIAAQSGNFSLDITGYTNNDFSGVQQTVATTIGATYALSFYLGTRNDVAGPYSIQACGGATCQTFTQTTTTPVGGLPINSWFLETLNFTATSTSTLVSLLGTATPLDYIGLDTASLVQTSGPSTVPLPGALPLFTTGLGALGLLGWRRKRKTQAV